MRALRVGDHLIVAGHIVGAGIARRIASRDERLPHGAIPIRHGRIGIERIIRRGRWPSGRR
jgi:hypothetical protein